MLHLQLPRKFRGQIAPKIIRQAVQAALRQQGVAEEADLTVRVTDDAELHRLNREFLGHDYVTDVLSFPAEEIDPVTQVRYLGDIVLSLPRAAAQAAQGGHPLSAEVQLLVVHGVLHLLGHDHAGKRAKARMWRAQAEILQALGVPITGPVQEA